MGFDDLAKHMAKRDGRKKSQSKTGDADQIVAEAIKADQRLNRTRDLVLGPLLLVGGLGIEVLVYSMLRNDSSELVREQSLSYVIMGGVFALGLIIVGLLKTIRGLTRRAPIGDAPEQILDTLVKPRD